MKKYTVQIAAIVIAVGCAWLPVAASFAQEGQPIGGNTFGPNLMGDATIQYDPETGQLIVITDDETNLNIGSIIESLDRPVPQVLIKVLFLEITHNNDSDIGIEGLFEWDSAGDRDMVETAFGIASETRGGFARIVESEFDITMRALAEVGKLEVLSRPSILARNNELATITVGQEVPFVRNSRVTQDGQTINTVEYEDIGIILQVTPHILPDRTVEMVVIPEISTITGETVPISDTIDAPVFAKRSAQTRVVVPDRTTVVIGGLMQDNNTEAVRKVPLLGDIPLLGWAFKRKIVTKSKTELLIFLTPHVVERTSELRNMSLSEKDDTVLVPEVFSDEQLNRYIDNLDLEEESTPEREDVSSHRATGSVLVPRRAASE